MFTVILWENTLSGEKGYVGQVSYKNKCFYDAEKVDGVRKYKNKKTAIKLVRQLMGYGQGMKRGIKFYVQDFMKITRVTGYLA